jgi:hypothetical protein
MSAEILAKHNIIITLYFSILLHQTIRENIKLSAKESLGYYELKKHKPWLDEGCLKIIRPKETSQTVVVTGSKQNKWG